MPTLLDSFPALYRPLLRDLDREIPPESKATCADCAMVAPSASTAVAPVDGRSRLFRADTKCCTYHPRLPNYLVGAILCDEDPVGAEGRRRIEARIASRVGVTPEWLHPPRTFTLLYESSRRAFGHARGLRCPLYEERDGTCTIWRHRDAVCSTWYCKYVAGEDGRLYWTAAKELLSLVEIQLARYALLQVFPDALPAGQGPARATGPLGPEDIDGEGAPAGEHAALWREWAGREVELYRSCHEVVRALDGATVDALLGLDGTLARRTLSRAADAMLSAALPQILMLDPNATVRWLPDGSVAMAAYSEHEGVSLPAAAYPLLLRFTGEAPVAEVRAGLRADLHADLSDDVLLELYRQRILVAPPGRSAQAAPRPTSR